MLIATQMVGFGAAGGGNTQADFDAHAATRGSDIGTISTSTSNDELRDLFSGSGTYRLKIGGAVGGSMWGSSWHSNGATEDGEMLPFILHALPSAAVYTTLTGGGQSSIIIVVTKSSGSSFSSVNRNGFASNSYGSNSDRYICTEITYWDTALGKAQTLNPSTQTGPTDYVW